MTTEQQPLKIKCRGVHDYKTIPLRIPTDLLTAIEQAAHDANYARNEMIVQRLEYGMETINIQPK